MKAFLTSQQRESLITEHKKERDRKRGDRLKVVLWSDEGVTQEEIAHRLFISISAVGEHLDAYKKEGRLTPNHKGSKPILTLEESEQLSTHLEIKIYTKVKEIQAYIKQTFSKEMAQSTIRNWLQSNEFSYKKPVLRPKSDPEKQIEFVEDYEQIANKAALHNEPVLFGDAVHPTQQTQASHGWFKRGKDKIIETTAGRKRINLIVALNLEDMNLVRKSFDTVNGAAAVEYLKEIEKAYPEVKNIHLVLDRAGYFTGKEVQKYLETSRIRVHFLPPRSPNLNPIERLWKVMHEHVSNNRVHDKFQDFKEALDHFFDVTMKIINDELISRISDNFQIINL